MSSPYGNSLNNFCLVYSIKGDIKPIAFKSKEEFEAFFANGNSSFILNFFEKTYIIKNFFLRKVFAYNAVTTGDRTIIQLENKYSVNAIHKKLKEIEDASVAWTLKLQKGFVFTKELFAQVNVMNHHSNIEVEDLTLHRDGIYTDFVE